MVLLTSGFGPNLPFANMPFPFPSVKGLHLLPFAPGDRERRIRSTMWLSMLEGSLFTVYFNWTTGAVLTGYLLALGAGPTLLAAAASLPLLVQVANPFLAWLASQQLRRLPYITLMASLSRPLWLFAAFIPMLPIAPSWWPVLLVALVGVSSLFQTAAGLAWIPLMAEVVPEPLRGRYFGLRN